MGVCRKSWPEVIYTTIVLPLILTGCKDLKRREEHPKESIEATSILLLPPYLKADMSQLKSRLNIEDDKRGSSLDPIGFNCGGILNNLSFPSLVIAFIYTIILRNNHGIALYTRRYNIGTYCIGKISKLFRRVVEFFATLEI